MGFNLSTPYTPIEKTDDNQIATNPSSQLSDKI